MRILFLESDPIWIFGLPNGFKDLGHQVMVSGVLSKSTIPKLLKVFKPDLIFTIGWGPEHKAQKRKWIRKGIKSSGIPHVYWATEDPTFLKEWSLKYIKDTKPDFIFTVTPSLVSYYRKLGYASAHLDFGYHSKANFPSRPFREYLCKIAVVANAYPNVLKKYSDHYRHHSLNTLITPILNHQIPIDLYGQNWHKMQPFIGCDIPQNKLHGHLAYLEANKVYNSAAINIGLQNDAYQLTQRTYEILGSGGFLLTSDTPEVRRSFNPNEDLIVSNSPQETLELVKYYLSHPDARMKIRKSGWAKVSKHSYTHRAKYIIDILKKENFLGINP